MTTPTPNAGHTPEPMTVEVGAGDEWWFGGPHKQEAIIRSPDGKTIVVGPYNTQDERDIIHRFAALYNALAGVADPASAVARWKRIDEAATDARNCLELGDQDFALKLLRTALAQPEVKP